MALALVQRQVQKQVASPAMMMELSLLTLPIADLREAVKKELDSNPALEIEPARGYRRTSVSSGGDKEGFLENVADERGETLYDHLLGELRMAGVEGRELELASAVAAELDSEGRFKGSFADLQMVTGAGAAELEKARERLMTIDPLGCGARDLAECYRAQLSTLPEAKREAAARAIDYVVEVQAGKRRLGEGAPKEADLKLLQKLNPYPGRLYDHRPVQAVTPDVRVDESGVVSVDQSDIPELRVSQKYVEWAKDREIDEETRKFAAEKVIRAREFREAVIRRRETVEKIANLAISGQKEFLARGVSGLRRQTMSEIAKLAKCEVSVVSRAAARKYVKTPRGTIPLRMFFVLVDQEPVEKLREILERIWLKERPSDQKLANMMAEAGFPMARRTIAKYRARLGYATVRGQKNSFI